MTFLALTQLHAQHGQSDARRACSRVIGVGGMRRNGVEAHIRHAGVGAALAGPFAAASHGLQARRCVFTRNLPAGVRGLAGLQP